MTNTIADNEDIAEALQLDYEDECSDLTATRAPEETPLEFHVQMNGHTFRDMEALIVEAAARQLLGRHSDNALATRIQTAVLDQVSRRIDEQLAAVTSAILDEPLKLGHKDVGTMRDFIGLAGREFLTKPVDRDGNPAEGGYYSRGEPRVQRLVSLALDRSFKDAVAKATNAAIVEVQKEIRAAHQEFLAGEKARLRAALAKEVGGAA